MNTRIVIFGNSGSGKSSLSKRLAKDLKLPHLDLDDVAWKEANPPVRHTLKKSVAAIDTFRANHSEWIIEGCYGSLIAHAVAFASHVYFLNIGTAACVANCKARPWEPHKYPTKEAQDKNLEMLTQWVREYDTRTDEFSLKEHWAIFNTFSGQKIEFKSNTESAALKWPDDD